MANLEGSKSSPSNLLRKGGGNQSLAQLLTDLQNTYGSKMAVATLATVSETITEWNGKYGRAAVTPIPKWDKDGTNYIEGYYFSEMSLSQGQIVLVVFTDSDFRANIEGGVWQPLKTENNNTHSRDFGVIIKL